MFYVYVIKNQQRKKIYIGQTINLGNRLQRHNGSLPAKTTSYTKINSGLWELVYSEIFPSRQGAIQREKYLKSHVGRDWLKTKLGA